MTDRIDHAAEARKHIEWAHDQQENEGDMGNVPRDNALLAQAEAILALVEQQRLANLLAVTNNAARMVAEGIGSRIEYLALYDQLNPVIREGLGL